MKTGEREDGPVVEGGRKVGGPLLLPESKGPSRPSGTRGRQRRLRLQGEDRRLEARQAPAGETQNLPGRGEGRGSDLIRTLS